MLILPIAIGGSTFETSILPVLNTELSQATTFTIVNKYRPGNIQRTGSTVRLIIEAGHTGGGTLTNTYIGLSATTGNVWDFASTPTAVTWNNGATSLTLVAGNTYTSDEITFTVDDVASISIAYNVAANTYVRYGSGLPIGWLSYTKASVNEAATVSKGASYTVFSGYNHFLSELQVAN